MIIYMLLKEFYTISTKKVSIHFRRLLGRNRTNESGEAQHLTAQLLFMERLAFQQIQILA